MILPIYTYGQPVLRKVAQNIDKDYPELKELIANMWETLANSEGIGLAAPQIGLPIRVVVIDYRLIVHLILSGVGSLRQCHVVHLAGDGGGGRYLLEGRETE